MSVHSWCRDVQRDEAVRAAEDGRDWPLPTLAEAISAARAMMPKSVSGSSAPEPENKGNGMRTERITLEVTHDLDAPLGDWIVQVVDESLGLAETVRVVEESAPAASVAAKEPVAWGVIAGGIVLATSTSRSDAVDMQSEHARDTVVVPLYAALPPARGWLTEEERAAVEWIIGFAMHHAARSAAVAHCHIETAKSLLARSSPPEVEGLPEKLFWSIGEPEPHWPTVKAVNDVIDKCRAALAAAGVAVKEVGK